MHSYFVGLDVHKQTIAYCIKKADGQIVREGNIRATRKELAEWVQTVPSPWVGGMETTLFSHWIYEHLTNLGGRVRMGHAARMKAISAGKKKSDKVDARTIADLLRCEMFPTCYVISPALRGLRLQMRFRRKLVEHQTRCKNQNAGILMQFGVEYEKTRLHGMRYFQQLLGENQWLGKETLPLLKFNQQQIRTLEQMDKRVLKVLAKEPELQQRFEALTAIDGVGPVTALTWALEIGTPERFGSIKRVQSYCGLTSAFWESAGKQKHGPISKQRNAHLQSVVIEAAKVAPMHNETLKAAYDKARAKGADNNLATLEVARKLVSFLLAADRAAVSGCHKTQQPA